MSAAISTAMRLRKEERPQSAEAYVEAVLRASGVHVSIAELAETGVEEVDLILASRVMPVTQTPDLEASTERSVSFDAPESQSDALLNQDAASVNLPRRGNGRAKKTRLVAGLAIAVAVGATVVYFLTRF